MKMKRFIACMMAVCVIVALAGCGSDSKGSSETEINTAIASENQSVSEPQSTSGVKAAPGEYFKDLLKVSVHSGASTFSPFARGNNYSSTNINFYEKLGDVDSDGNLKLLMLKSIEKVDELTYSCELWDFITDTSGNTITSEDVLWSIEEYKNSGHEGDVSRLDYIEVTGDYTFIWHNKEPFALGEYMKQISNPFILSQASYESDPDEMANNPVGTGPYKLKEFEEGSYAVFEANEDYWFNKITDTDWLEANEMPWSYQNFREIRVDVLSDASARAIALENGDTDICTNVASADADQYGDNDNITLFYRPNSNPVTFTFNCSDISLCADENLRKAICYALNSQEISDGLEVHSQVAYGFHPRMLDAPESWSTGEGTDYYDYNLEKAKEYLDKSDYNGEVLKILYQNDNNRNAAYVMIQAQLKEIGINTDMTCLETSSFENAIFDFDSFDIRSLSVGGGEYLPNTLRWFWSENYDNLNPLTILGIEEPELDRLYVDLCNNHSDETINAWNDYFTNEKCYAYTLANIDDTAGCLSEYIPCIVGTKSDVCPGGFGIAD